MRQGVLIAWLALCAACTEERAPVPQEPAASRDAPPEAAPAAPAPEAPEAAPSAPENAPSTPVDELPESELEAACFRGRQEACDRLGH